MRHRLPPLNALRAFEAAARHLSFVRAAEELAVTPAAISQQVRTLETALDVQLFRRLPRGLLLTEVGRAYAPALSDAFDRLLAATNATAQNTPRGVLVVSIMPSFGHGWLVPRLPQFQARYPDVDVRLLAEPINADLFGGEADVGLRYGRGDYPGLIADMLMTEEIFPVCSPSLLTTGPPLRQWDDLRHHTLLHDEDGDRTQDPITWGYWMERLGLDPGLARRGPRFSDTTMIYQATVMGHGISLGRSVIISDHLRAGRLVRLFDDGRHEGSVPSQNSYYVATTPAARQEPKIAAFVDWVIEAARDPTAN